MILTLDTNTDILSCSITKEKELISEISISNIKNHSIKSIDIIDNCLKNSNITLNDIDCFVISKGPGSFTGLRIAFSIIKAFCFSLKKPMISISSLESLSFRENFNGITCSIMNALRGDVYINSYENKNSIIHSHFEDEIIKSSEISHYIKNKHNSTSNILFTGDGTNIYKEILLKDFKNAYLNETPMTSYNYALLGYEKFKLGLFDDINSSVPTYIRVSQAQEMLLKKRKND